MPGRSNCSTLQRSCSTLQPLSHRAAKLLSDFTTSADAPRLCFALLALVCTLRAATPSTSPINPSARPSSVAAHSCSGAAEWRRWAHHEADTVRTYGATTALAT